MFSLRQPSLFSSILLFSSLLFLVCNADLIVSPPSGALVISPAYIAYTAQSVVSIVNPNNSTAFQITGYSFGNPQDSQWGVQIPSLTIAPNSTSTITLLLTAAAGGAVSNSFSFTTSDPDVPSISYNISATVTLPPVLTASPSYTTLFFGDGSPTSHKPATILIGNNGTVDLTVSATIQGSSPQGFIVTPMTFTVQPNAAEQTLTVTCETSAYGDLLALLVLQTNDPVNPFYTYQLSCWSVHMGRDVAVGFLILLVFWIVFAVLLWALFAFKQ